MASLRQSWLRAFTGAAMLTLAGSGFAATGLLGQYYTGTPTAGDKFDRNTIFGCMQPILTRVDDGTHNFPATADMTAAIDMTWGDPGSPDASVAVNGFAARWTGTLKPAGDVMGLGSFVVNSDDGMRIWVKDAAAGAINQMVDVPLTDRWYNTGAGDTVGTPITLDAAKTYNVIVEFYENTGGASAQLKWQPDGGTAGGALIPAAVFTAATAPAPVADTTAPGAVTDLMGTADSATSVTVTFTSPGNDGATGMPGCYDVRYSLSPITDANFNNANKVNANGVVANPVAAGAKVTLKLDGLEGIQRYYLAVKTGDGAGNKGALSNIASVDTPAATAGVNLERWDNIGGTAVNDLLNNDAYKTGLPSLNTLIATPYYHPTGLDNYGARMRGYFVPKTTGNYLFWVSSDDNSALYVSTDENPANIPTDPTATVTSWTNNLEWTKMDTQHGVDVMALTAGKKYYFVAYQKEGGGGDSLAVGVSDGSTNADGTFKAPTSEIPADQVQPFMLITNGRIAGYVTDASGAPVASADVAVKVGTVTANVKTDANGYYSALVDPGSATATATMTPFTDTATVNTNVVAGKFAAGDLKFSVTLPPFKPSQPDAAKSDDFNGTTLKPIWKSEDVAAALDGGATITNNMLDITGIGADIWDGGDHFHYVYQTISGDFQAVAHVVNVPNTDGWSKAGVMVREAAADGTIDPMGYHFFSSATRDNSQSMQGRTIISDVDGTDTNINVQTVYGFFPQGTGYWVKVVRKGPVFQAFWSPDGISPRYISMQDYGAIKLSDGTAAPKAFQSPSVLVGIASTTHQAAPAADAKSDSLVDDFIISSVLDVPGGGTCKPGDVNGDTNVNVSDAVLALKAAAKLIILTPEQTKAADVVAGGGVNVADAVKILRVAAKLDTLPATCP